MKHWEWFMSYGDVVEPRFGVGSLHTLHAANFGLRLAALNLRGYEDNATARLAVGNLLHHDRVALALGYESFELCERVARVFAVAAYVVHGSHCTDVAVKLQINLVIVVQSVYDLIHRGTPRTRDGKQMTTYSPQHLAALQQTGTCTICGKPRTECVKQHAAQERAITIAKSTAQDTRARRNSAGSLIVGSRVRIAGKWYSNID